ncbi:organic solute transporter subunit alpha-like [Amphiura filiformis]|uniref:organic solute transporter subunit alpha-like n=1 Tax=Amphiura filiformis TaxID=82378 RepID=UPI003B221B7B
MAFVPNCTNPSASEVFREELPDNPALIAILSIATIITIVEWIVFIEAAYYVNTNLPYHDRAVRNIWIIGIYPVYCFTSLLALYVPRAALLCTIAANFYFFPCLYHYFQLMLDYFGGLDAMVQKYKDTDGILWGRPPLCCWFMGCGRFKWAKIKITRRNILILETLTMQIAVFRPLVLFLTQVLKLDLTFPLGVMNASGPFLYLTLTTVFTTLSAMTSLTILYRGMRDELPQYNVVPKFLCTQIALILANLQPGVMLVLVSTGVLVCEDAIFPHVYRGEQWHGFALICESVLLYPMVLKYFRGLKGNLLYMPGSLKKTRSYGGSSTKTMEDEMGGTEKQPLRKVRSGSSLSEYGTVETV